MKKILFSLICICLILSSGCQNGCISLAGTYKDFGGELSWCIDKEASQTTQRNILTNEHGDSATLLTEEETQQLNTILEEKIISAGIRSSSTKNLTPMEKFSELIRKIHVLK